MVQEVREIMAQLGIRKFNDIIARTDLLQQRDIDHWKAHTIDLSDILYRPEEADSSPNHCIELQVHKIDDVLDRALIDMADAALKHQVPVSIDLPITNSDRAVGAMLSSKISRLCGEEGFPENTIDVTFYGSGGQSFGAFLAKGIKFRLYGDTNHTIGQGVAGGRTMRMHPDGG